MYRIRIFFSHYEGQILVGWSGSSPKLIFLGLGRTFKCYGQFRLGFDGTSSHHPWRPTSSTQHGDEIQTHPRPRFSLSTSRTTSPPSQRPSSHPSARRSISAVPPPFPSSSPATATVPPLTTPCSLSGGLATSSLTALLPLNSSPAPAANLMIASSRRTPTARLEALDWRKLWRRWGWTRWLWVGWWRTCVARRRRGRRLWEGSGFSSLQTPQRPATTSCTRPHLKTWLTALLIWWIASHLKWLLPTSNKKGISSECSLLCVCQSVYVFNSNSNVYHWILLLYLWILFCWMISASSCLQCPPALNLW